MNTKEERSTGRDGLMRLSAGFGTHLTDERERLEAQITELQGQVAAVTGQRDGAQALAEQRGMERDAAQAEVARLRGRLGAVEARERAVMCVANDYDDLHCDEERRSKALKAACRRLAEQRDTAHARVRELEAEAADWRDAHRRVMAEDCPSDEHHCACVPALRVEAERLRGLAREARDMLATGMGLPCHNEFIVDVGVCGKGQACPHKGCPLHPSRWGGEA